MRRTRAGTAIAVTTLILTVVPGMARAQANDLDPRRALLSRDSLEGLVALYAQSAESPAYSPALRSSAAREAEIIRTRLREGDFQTGDRILFWTENTATVAAGGPIAVAYDTLIVSAARTVVITGVGSVSIVGALRSEIESFLGQQVARVQRDAVVHARSFVRVAVIGQVGRPGFYVIPSEALLEQAVMLAGGPSNVAELRNLRVQRGGQTIWEGDRLRAAMAEGRTIDEMGLRAGDQIELPPKPLANSYAQVQALGLILGMSITVASLIGRL